MKLHQSLKLLLIILSLGVLSSAAEAASESPQSLVEVELWQDNLAPYKDRRDDRGSYVGLVYENLDLTNFVSTLDAKKYGELFSSPLPLIRFSVDYKYNLALGSFSVGLDVGKGSLSDNHSGQDRTLDILKYGVGVKYTADMILDEPYIAPYVGLNFWQMAISEKSPTDEFSATTQMGMNYTVGLLLQLDWLDYDTAKYTTFSWGLENTFIDVYATKYAQTSASDDPNTETDFCFGAGVRLEF